MAAIHALRVLSSHSSACSSSSSLSSSRKKKASIATKHSSSHLGRRVIAHSSSSSSSSSSPESTNRSPRRRKKGREPLRAILEPCVLEPRSMDESDDNGETEKMITKKTRKRTMTSKDPREDDNRSAATIVETDFLVRFRVSGVFTARLLEERCTTTTTTKRRRTTKHRCPFFFTRRRRGVHAHLSSRSKSSSSLRYRLTKAFFPL
jgi:hypothetical protein